MFKIIPVITAMNAPESCIPKTVMLEPRPKPKTNINATINRFLECVKSRFASANVLSPTAEIIPNNIRHTPPITELGIVFNRLPNGATIPSTTAKIAVNLISAGS